MTGYTTTPLPNLSEYTFGHPQIVAQLWMVTLLYRPRLGSLPSLSVHVRAQLRRIIHYARLVWSWCRLPSSRPHVGDAIEVTGEPGHDKREQAPLLAISRWYRDFVILNHSVQPGATSHRTWVISSPITPIVHVCFRTSI